VEFRIQAISELDDLGLFTRRKIPDLSNDLPCGHGDKRRGGEEVVKGASGLPAVLVLERWFG